MEGGGVQNNSPGTAVRVESCDGPQITDTKDKMK